MSCSTQIVLRPRPGYHIGVRVVSPKRSFFSNRDKSGKDQELSGFVAGDHLIFFANSISAETAWYQLSSPGGLSAWTDDLSPIVGGGPSFSTDPGNRDYNLGNWMYWSTTPAVTYVDEIVIDSVVCGTLRAVSSITSHKVEPGSELSYIDKLKTPFTDFYLYHAPQVPLNDTPNNVLGWTPADNSPVSHDGPFTMDDSTPLGTELFYKVVQITPDEIVIPYNLIRVSNTQ